MTNQTQNLKLPILSFLCVLGSKKQNEPKFFTVRCPSGLHRSTPNAVCQNKANFFTLSVQCREICGSMFLQNKPKILHFYHKNADFSKNKPKTNPILLSALFSGLRTICAKQTQFMASDMVAGRKRVDVRLFFRYSYTLYISSIY